MALNRQELIELARNVAKRESVTFGNTTLTSEQMNKTLLNELRELMPKGDYYAFEQNKALIMEILTEIVKHSEPRVIKNMLDFAEIKRYGQNEKVKFLSRGGRSRAKRFVTRVGLAGVYEAFRLDTNEFEVQTNAYGGAGSISLERLLDGHETLAEVAEIIAEGISDRIFEEIIAALTSLKSTLPTANVYTHNAFDGAKMRELLMVARAYGEKVQIFCFPEFAATIIPDANFISNKDKEDVRELGYIGRYSGADVIVVPQTFQDDTNSKKVFDPSMALIVPSSGNINEKPIKVALEGDALFRTQDEKDWSTTVESYQKLGVAITAANHICVYENTALR